VQYQLNGEDILVFSRRPDKPEDHDKEKTAANSSSSDKNVLQLEARLDALDQRLDNIDSMVTAVAERVMSRPMIIMATCPHCGKNMEISLIGTQKPAK
jgi:hypothetical protein